LFQEVGILASVLSATPMFRGLRYDDRRCLYATNGVKVYVPENRGKRAAHLEAGDFDAHEQQWRDELKLLAEEGAMPHVVIIFSQVYWEYAWKAFHPKHGGPALGVSDFEPISGDAPHRLNRITITREGREHPLLLVRLLHPTGGRGDVGTAEWLTERKAFQSAVGNTDTE
jgi:hypothetical protein